MNIVGALIIRLTHTGLKPDGSPNLSSVTIYDLEEPTASVTRPRSVPVPVGSGTLLSPVDIAMSTRTFISWSTGAICKFVQNGYLTAEVLLQLRDKGHGGGPAGTGQTLRPAVLNIERVSNVLRMVIPDNVIPTTLDSVGFLINEDVDVTGLTGAFLNLNGTHTISTATPGDGLAGTAAGSYLLEFSSTGPNIAAATLAGVNLLLSQGRVTVEMNANGDTGGLGANVFGYIGGQLFPNVGGGGGGAPVGAAYVTMSLDGTLTAERVLTAGPGIGIVDGGANGPVTISAPGTGSTGLFQWGNSSVANSTATRYLDPGFENRIAPLAPIQLRAPRAGTVRNLYIEHNNPGGSGATITYTVRVNGAPSILTIGVASTSIGGADTVNSVVVAAGDRIDIEVTKGAVAGAGDRQPEATVEIAA